MSGTVSGSGTLLPLPPVKRPPQARVRTGFPAELWITPQAGAQVALLQLFAVHVPGVPQSALAAHGPAQSLLSMQEVPIFVFNPCVQIFSALPMPVVKLNSLGFGVKPQQGPAAVVVVVLEVVVVVVVGAAVVVVVVGAAVVVVVGGGGAVVVVVAAAAVVVVVGAAVVVVVV